MRRVGAAALLLLWLGSLMPALAFAQLAPACSSPESAARCRADDGAMFPDDALCYGPRGIYLILDPKTLQMRRCTEAERAEAKAAGRSKSERFRRVVKERLEFAAKCPSLPIPKVGMKQDEVREGTQWGRPAAVNTTTTGRHRYEQWVFHPGFFDCLYPNFVNNPDSGRGYLYFTDGVLTGMQTEH